MEKSRDTEQASRAILRSVFFDNFFQFGTFSDERSVSIGFLMCFQNSECMNSDDFGFVNSTL